LSMPSTRDLRRRIKSVRSTRQITKAMELVATAKMRRASEATLASRPYITRLKEVLADILSHPVEGLTHPLLASRVTENPKQATRRLIFAISSDRGLAGSYNSNLTKSILDILKHAKEVGEEVSFITMGRKVEQLLRKL